MASDAPPNKALQLRAGVAVRYTAPELDRYEATHGLRIPDRLRLFLMSRGTGEYGHLEIHQLDCIESRYAEFFDDPSELFRLYLPFGCNNQTQELWVLDVSLASPRFAKIWHETVPDDWPEEEWSEFATCRDPDLDQVGV